MDVCTSQVEGSEQEQATVEDMVTVEDVVGMTATVDNCLFLNRVYQELVSDSIQRLEAILSDNREQQKLLRGKLNEPAESGKPGGVIATQKYKHSTVFSYPYFKNKAGFLQPPNEDTKSKLVNQDLDPYLRPPRPWSSVEKKQLSEAVTSTSLQKTLQPLLVKKELLQEKLLDSKNTGSDNEEILLKIAKTDELLSKKDFTEEFLSGSVTQDHDWLKISTIDFEGKRTARECELMWKNLVHPSINRHKWTREEDLQLQAAVAKHGKDWESIAIHLGTNRTSLQCIERFQSNFDEHLVRSNWTPEEDKTLAKLVENCRIGDFIPWNQVSHYMEGRTRSHVARRWNQKVNPEVVKGKWTVKEDMMLIAAVAKYDCDWKSICSFVPGRTNAQCRERYTNCLDLAISCQHWEPEEDKQLIQLVETKNRKWSEVAKFFPGRTDSMVAKRYSRLRTITKDKEEGGENVEEQGASNSEMKHPKSYVRKKLYRLKIYRMLLKQLRQIDTKITEDYNSVDVKELQESFRIVEQNDLDALILVLQTKLGNKIATENRKPVPSITADDYDLVNYFSKIQTDKKIGRPPVKASKLQTSDKTYQLVTALILRVLKSQVKLSNEVTSLHSFVTENPLLPPTCTTITAMKNFASSLHRKNQRIDSVNDHSANDGQKFYACSSFDGNSIDPSNVNQWQLLLTRFVSSFFWPVFLSHLSFDSTADEPNTSPAPPLKYKKTHFKPKLRKRPMKKPWVRNRMRELANERWQKSQGEREDKAETNVEVKCSTSNEQELSKVEETTQNKKGRPSGSRNKRKVELLPSERRQSVRIGAKRTRPSTD